VSGGCVMHASESRPDRASVNLPTCVSPPPAAMRRRGSTGYRRPDEA
jgi:hypothetical protein